MPEFSEGLESQIENSQTGERVFPIHLENVEITPNRPYEFQLKVKKQPLDLKSGDTLGSNNTKVEFTGRLAEMREEAEKLKILPEAERIRAVLNLVRRFRGSYRGHRNQYSYSTWKQRAVQTPSARVQRHRGF